MNISKDFLANLIGKSDATQVMDKQISKMGTNPNGSFQKMLQNKQNDLNDSGSTKDNDLLQQSSVDENAVSDQDLDEIADNLDETADNKVTTNIPLALLSVWDQGDFTQNDLPVEAVAEDNILPMDNMVEVLPLENADLASQPVANTASPIVTEVTSALEEALLVADADVNAANDHSTVVSIPSQSVVEPEGQIFDDKTYIQTADTVQKAVDVDIDGSVIAVEAPLDNEVEVKPNVIKNGEILANDQKAVPTDEKAVPTDEKAQVVDAKLQNINEETMANIQALASKAKTKGENAERKPIIERMAKDGKLTITSSENRSLGEKIASQTVFRKENAENGIVSHNTPQHTLASSEQTVSNDQAGQTSFDQLLTRDEQQEVLNQVVQRMRIDINQEQTEMNVRLNPENLGQVNMRLIWQNGKLNAHFVATTESAKEALQANIQQLRENLQNQGVKVEKIEVMVNSGDLHFNQQRQDEGLYQQAQEISKNWRRASDVSDDYEVLDEIDKIADTNRSRQIINEKQVDYIV